MKSQLFGTGFPTLPRQLPKTRVDQDKTIFYDASAFSAEKLHGFSQMWYFILVKIIYLFIFLNKFLYL